MPGIYLKDSSQLDAAPPPRQEGLSTGVLSTYDGSGFCQPFSGPELGRGRGREETVKDSTPWHGWGSPERRFRGRGDLRLTLSNWEKAGPRWVG